MRTHTIFFVLIFQYLWIDQNPKVDAVDVMAWAKPRYVFCRKLKENLSFWQIDTSVPVVFRPCIEDQQLMVWEVTRVARVKTYIS